VPKDLEPKLLDELVRDITKRGDMLTTGFVGTSYLPFVLSKHNRMDVAYKLLFQKKWPSWLYAVTQGATTIWERWDGWTQDKGFQDAGMNSFNHYAYGAIGSWMYAVVAGLDVHPDAPGYKKLLIRPRPGGGLTKARAKLHTMYGEAESSWKIKGKTFELKVLVPANTSAQVVLPGDVETGPTGILGGPRIYEVPAGKYVFTCKLSEN